MKQRNAKRKGSAFPKKRDAAYQRYVRGLPCTLSWGVGWASEPDGHRRGCAGRVQCAHVKSRGAAGADVGNCIPLCASHHDHQHRLGIKTFQVRYNFDMLTVAGQLADRWYVLGGLRAGTDPQ